MTQQQNVGYARRIGPFSGTMMVVGGIIGSGIFLNPSIVAQRVGTGALTMLVWGIGAIVAILADLGMGPAEFNGVFMIARTPGLIAHVIEEQTREKPMRRIDPVNHGYDGPAARTL